MLHAGNGHIRPNLDEFQYKVANMTCLTQELLTTSFVPHLHKSLEASQCFSTLFQALLHVKNSKKKSEQDNMCWLFTTSSSLS